MENTFDPLSFPTSDSETYAKPKLSRPHLVGLGMLAVFMGFFSGYLVAMQWNLRDALSSKVSDFSDGPFVETAQAVLSSQDHSIKLHGETLPYATATLYAKVSGYLGEIFVDKGDRVKKGQILATIISPETTSRFASALADGRNKKIKADRVKALFRSGDVTDDERDQAVAAADIAAAHLGELEAQRGYTTILAPFEGTITARFADPGALVQDAANARSGALPVVTVSQVSKLRVTTYVDEDDASFVRVGDPAIITLAKRPGLSFEAQVSRVAGELDTRSRTMLTEIELDNQNEEFVPGGFVDVTLLVKMPQTIQVPSQALVMKAGAPFVAVVSKDNSVHYRAVTIGENEGPMINILSGLKEDESVVLSMGNRLTEGQHVQVDSFIE